MKSTPKRRGVSCRKVGKSLVLRKRYGKTKGRGGGIANCKQSRLHSPAPFVITIQPPFRPPDTCILAEHRRVPMHHPRTHTDHGPAPKASPAHGGALGRHDAFERQPERRVQTASFFDARVQVGEGARLLEWGGRANWGRREGVELGEEAGKGGGVGEEAVEGGAEEDGSCVAASGYVGGCPCCEGPRWSD